MKPLPQPIAIESEALVERLKRAAVAAQERIETWQTFRMEDVLANISKVNSYGVQNILH